MKVPNYLDTTFTVATLTMGRLYDILCITFSEVVGICPNYLTG